MRISASNGCWFTGSQEPAEGRRTFVKDVFITSVEEISRWREVTDSEKENIDLNDRLLNPDDLNYKYIKQVDTLLEGITSKINTLGLTAEEALDVQSHFPRWENLIGEDESAGFRFQYGGTLYEVIQPHTFSAEWVPGQGTESLYKVVQEEHEGTRDNPIPYPAGQTPLEQGKYYTEDGQLYLCIQQGGVVIYDLSQIPAIAQPVNE